MMKISKEKQKQILVERQSFSNTFNPTEDISGGIK